jgi:hypothetical protein
VVAYLVLTHTNIPQVHRLVRRLAAQPDAVVFIRHDGAVHRLRPTTFAAYDNVHVFSTTYPVSWGRFSLLQTALDGIEAAFASGIAFDWMMLVSGQDYVCTDLPGFHRRLANATVDGFLDHVPADDPHLGTENADRYYFRYRELPSRLRKLNARLWRLNTLQPWVRFSDSRLGSFIGVADRKIFKRWPLYRGSFWWALSRPCLEELVRVRHEEHALIEAYRHRPFPEESFFQTVLLAAKRFTFSNDDLRYIRWDDPMSGSPAVFRTADIPELLASGKPFARKFDLRVDPTVFDRLDRAVGEPLRVGD